MADFLCGKLDMLRNYSTMQTMREFLLLFLSAAGAQLGHWRSLFLQVSRSRVESFVDIRD